MASTPPASFISSFRRTFALLLLVVLPTGCTTTHSSSALSNSQNPRSLIRTELGGSAGGFPEQPDAFQSVQQASGLEEAFRHPRGSALYVPQARQLWERLAKTSVTQRSFAPRRALAWLLRTALSGGQRVEYADLCQRLERFRQLVLVRPDGYLVTALSGEPIQRMGRVTLEQGAWMVGRLEVGAFYASRGGVLYPVDESLRRLDTEPWAEVGLERDWLNAALDGTQDAMAEVAVALAQSVLHPIHSAEGLLQLPTSVALLIASSPEYFAHYGALSLQDQIHEAARLSTHLLLLYGGTAGTVGRMGGLGAELPVLSLTGKGELAVALVRVPVGTVVTSLGVGAGSVSILHMSHGTQDTSGGASGPSEGSASTPPPGRWVYKKPTTESQDALDYQEQVTGQPPSRVYVIENVEFDGFTGTELLEAKGPGYIKFFNKDGSPKYWYAASGGFNGLLEQANAQSKMAERVRMPLAWYVADAEVAKALRKIFAADGLKIDVRHKPAAR